jgi:hypothetical protein
MLRHASVPVEVIIDQWNPSRRRYRTETFCTVSFLASYIRLGRCEQFLAAGE